MKLTLRLIPILAVAITIVTFIVAQNQVRSEKRGLRADLERRAEILAESLQETVEPVLQWGSVDQLQRIVERFGSRERLAGVAVYNEKGKVLAVSSKLGSHANNPPSVFTQIKEQDQGIGAYEQIAQSTMYIYALPLHRESKIVGVLFTFYDTSYIEAQSARIWRETLWHVVAQLLLIILITSFVIRWTIVGPITRVAKWMRDLRNGKVVPFPLRIAESFLGPLSTEAASLAQKLAEARAAAKEEAQLREAGDSLWTAERLHASIERRLRGSSLFVVSNREPYQHVYGGKGIEARVPASGLVTALEPILCACDGTWIAYGSAEADRETVDAQDRLRVPPDHPHYTLRRIWLTKEEENGYYFGFANEGLWPLCHIAHTRPVFRADDWEHYQRVNEKFAAAVLEEIAGADRPFVLIQDFHFALLPRLIKAKRPDARVAIFWHIPWPNPEAFRICPWERELLNGLLGADLVSFHIQAHCNNFLDTVEQSLECRIEWDRFAVNRNDHFTLVRAHPISVGLPECPESVMEVSPEENRADVLAKLGSDILFLGVGVDRVDYTKGIVERFRAIERFFEKYPQYLEQFTFVQFGAPSRLNIKRYQDLLNEVAAEADRISRRFQTEKWRPIVLFSRHHSHEEIEPFYRAANFCFVTSLHDGMNLVSKEFVAARKDQDGVLILSQFTGASRELHDALLVNPYDIDQMAETIRRALEMPLEERCVRMQRMRRVVREHNVYRWAGELISELSEIRLDTREMVETR
ncbi:MAG: trehalose-6-phosphate synthase [Acidobacteriia bacterium]|nr:trehalose-6-phosphate synthase [Terriglobia bacterium]